LRPARFYIHTHNSIAGLMMVLQMRSSGYSAEFRPFGLDPALLLSHDEDEPTTEGEPPADEGPRPMTHTPEAPAGTIGRLIGRLKRYWRSVRGSGP
jgi:hypothetical protein